MQRKCIFLFILLLILLWISPVYALDTSEQPIQTVDTQNESVQTQTDPTLQEDTQPSSTIKNPDPFAALFQDNNGMRSIEPIDIEIVGDTAIEWGNKVYNFLLKARVLISTLGIGGSVLLMLIGIFFGRKIIVAGITGIFITIIVFFIIQYMPEILVTVKSALDTMLLR
jgi:hypothetical protein